MRRLNRNRMSFSSTSRCRKGNGLTILPVIRELNERIQVIMLTSVDTSESVHTAISLGAKRLFREEYHGGRASVDSGSAVDVHARTGSIGSAGNRK